MHYIRGETMVLDEGAKFKTEKAAPYSISIQTYLFFSSGFNPNGLTSS